MGKGRPQGSLNKMTVRVKELLSEHAEEITEKVIALAKEGDTVAVRVVMDRICPVRPGAPITWDMPPIHAPADMVGAYTSMANAIAQGNVTPAEGLQIKSVLDGLMDHFHYQSPWPLDAYTLIERYEQSERKTKRCGGTWQLVRRSGRSQSRLISLLVLFCVILTRRIDH